MTLAEYRLKRDPQGTPEPGARARLGRRRRLKKRDEGADARRKPARTQPRSVLSGKTLEQLRRHE